MRHRTLELATVMGIMLAPMGYAFWAIHAHSPVPAAACVQEAHPAAVHPEQPTADRPTPPPRPQLGPAPTDPLRFAHVEGQFLVLATDVPEAWGRGEATRLQPEGTDAYGVWIDPVQKSISETVPAKYTRATDLVFDLYDAHGVVCTARAGSLRVASHVGGDPWTLLDADDVHTLDQLDRPASELSPRLRAKRRDTVKTLDARAYTEGPRRLEAKFSVVDGDCEGALWGRATDLRTPLILAPHPYESDAAKREVLRSEAISESRRDYPGADYGLPTWDVWFDRTFEAVQWGRVSDVEEGATLITALVGDVTMESECGDEIPEAIGMLGWDRDGRFSHHPQPVEMGPLAMWRDGETLHVLSEGVNGDRSLMVQTEDGSAFEAAMSLWTQYYGCPC